MTRSNMQCITQLDMQVPPDSPCHVVCHMDPECDAYLIEDYHCITFIKCEQKGVKRAGLTDKQMKGN